MNDIIAFIHTYAPELIAVWAAFSAVCSLLPTPAAFAAYYEIPKCPAWYKTVYAIGHVIAVNPGRIFPSLRFATQDKKGGSNAPA